MNIKVGSVDTWRSNKANKEHKGIDEEENDTQQKTRLSIKKR